MPRLRTIHLVKKIEFVMHNKMLFIALLFCTLSLNGQDSEETLVIQTIQKLFDGMRAGDSTAVRSLFASHATMQSVSTDRDGQPQLKEGAVDGFVEAVGTPHEEIWDEKIWSYQVNIDDRLATVWTDYTFYRGTQLSHCGVNAFQLFKGQAGWKIIHITDTRRRTDCKKDPKIEIDELMDQWHRAAAQADENSFFGSMAPDAIYIGTDASERWDKKTFEAWSKKYFDREKAWDFKPLERAVYFAENTEVAWFNETLDTWMGVCRGSGVIEKLDGQWRLQHYHLAITVPNEKVKAFLELMETKE
ncbi:MAG: nuclear transport factor 2 family protein [Bacteroidota bacterium]